MLFDAQSATMQERVLNVAFKGGRHRHDDRLVSAMRPDQAADRLQVPQILFGARQEALVAVLVEDMLGNAIAQGVDVIVDEDRSFSVSASGDHRRDGASLHLLAQTVGIVAPVGDKYLRLGTIGIHERKSTIVIGGLARCDLDGYWETGTVGAEVELCREATLRAPKTLARSPPFAPAAQ
jgi:hypothetical protein